MTLHIKQVTELDGDTRVEARRFADGNASLIITGGGHSMTFMLPSLVADAIVAGFGGHTVALPAGPARDPRPGERAAWRMARGDTASGGQATAAVCGDVGQWDPCNRTPDHHGHHDDGEGHAWPLWFRDSGGDLWRSVDMDGRELLMLGDPDEAGAYTDRSVVAASFHPLTRVATTEVPAAPHGLPVVGVDAVAAALNGATAALPVDIKAGLAEITGADDPGGWSIQREPAGASGEPAGWYLYGPACPDGDWLGDGDKSEARAAADEQILAYGDMAAHTIPVPDAGCYADPAVRAAIRDTLTAGTAGAPVPAAYFDPCDPAGDAE